MTIADIARDNALHFEGVKIAYRQTKDGVIVSFVVHPNEVPDGLATAPLGSRYVVALVQVGDDEKPLPINQPAKGIKTFTAATAPDDPKPAGAKRDWRDVQPAAQSGIRCAEPTFRAFLRETRGFDVQDKLQAEIAVRDICGVESRVEFSTKPDKAALWKQIDDSYQAWSARERVGA